MIHNTTRQGKRLLLEALAGGDNALKLSSAIASARKVFRDRELQEHAELQVSREPPHLPIDKTKLVRIVCNRVVSTVGIHPISRSTITARMK